MRENLKFPLRFKMLVAQLLVVTVVLSLITFTMAKLFHADKTAYIHDLTSTMAVHISEEANALLVGYRERVRLFARVMAEEHGAERARVLAALFGEFPEFVMVTRSEGGKEETVSNTELLQSSGVSAEAVRHFRAAHPLPHLRVGEPYLENSTISPKLPTLTVTLREGEEAHPVTVSAVIRLAKLQRLAHRSRVFETFLLDSSGTLMAHSDPAKVAKHLTPLWRARLKKIHSAGMTLEYVDGEKGMVGGFAPVRGGGLTAVVQIPKTAAYLTSRQLLGDLLSLSLVLLAAAALLTMLWSRRVTRPIEELSEATRVVAQGNFEIQLVNQSGDEIGALASSFNTMAAELMSREKSLKELYGQLIQSEKMAAFGALGAGIAHEVKNPLAGILGSTQLSLRGVDEAHPLKKNLLIIEKETKRCKTIIENLLRFARQEQVEFSDVDLGQVVGDAVAIVDHQMGINNVRVEKELEDGLPHCRGNSNQLQQVLMNLMINAQQAMEGAAGTVRVCARRNEDGQVELRVIDDGPGIPDEVKARVFEPFFTTKPAGKGTGLGLSVSYGIVKDHGGEIRIETGAEGGTTFIITLPAGEEAAAVA